MHCTVDLHRLSATSLQGSPHDGADSTKAIHISGVGAAFDVAQDHRTLLIAAGEPRAIGTETRLVATALLERYERDADTFLSGLHGSFAVAVIDTRDKHVLLANDRMGRCGWCYAFARGVLRFSDRADLPGDAADIDPQGLFTYLFDHVIPSPDTVYVGVSRLPPGHRLSCSAAGVELAPHWRAVFTEPRQPDFAALRDEFRSLVRSAVAREWRRCGCRTVGTFLSGGTDSSTVTGMLRDVAGHPVRAYSIGFEADGYDEMEYASLAAGHFGAEHRQHYLTADEVCADMPLVAAHYDQPFGNSSAVAAYRCARFARDDGCTLLLAGDGGDELFGGNARYAKQRLFGLYDGVPSAMRRLVLDRLLANNPLAARLPLVSKAASYVQQARVPMPDRLNMYNLLLRIGLDQVLTPGFRNRIDVGLPLAGHRNVYRQSEGAHLVNRMLAFDWKFTLADNDLPKVCGTAALAGIGIGFPLLSDELIDFSLKLPAHYKLNGLKLRWFFKEALRGFLPDKILAKKKQGFGLPFGIWALRHERLSKLADEALASFATRGVVLPGFIVKLRRDLLPAHPGYYGELVWILTMLEFWLRERRPEWRLDR